MIRKIMAATLRFELLLLLAGAWVIALASAPEARADGTNCVDACTRDFGPTFTRNGRFYVLADCGASELGTGRVFCLYVGHAL